MNVLEFELKGYDVKRVDLLKKAPIERRCILCGEYFNGGDLVVRIIALPKNYREIRVVGFDRNGKKIPRSELLKRKYYVHLKCVFKVCSREFAELVKKEIRIPFSGKIRKRIKSLIQIWFYKYVKLR